MSNSPVRAHNADEAIVQLLADHLAIKRMFRELEVARVGADDDRRRTELVEELCYQLRVNTMVAEEILYPGARTVIDNDDLLDDLEARDAGVRDLIDRLDVMFPGDEHYDATITVLIEEFEQRIADIDNELFPKLKLSKLDLLALGLRIRERKDELDEDFAAPPKSLAPTRHTGRRRVRARH